LKYAPSFVEDIGNVCAGGHDNSFLLQNQSEFACSQPCSHKMLNYLVADCGCGQNVSRLVVVVRGVEFPGSKPQVSTLFTMLRNTLLGG
jgi:hypothetical protein